jgi:hypothetical protein
MLRVNMANKRKAGLTLQRTVGLTLLLLGLIALLLATVYAVSIPAFIGLGLTFWGIVLLYIETEEYTKTTILDATATSLMTTLNQTIQELDYKGKAVYLPPKYLNNPEATKAYLPKLTTGKLPPPEQTQKLEAQASTPNAQGLLITPPGAELTKLFEKTLGTTFTRMNLDNLQQTLPKLLIEDLDLATDLEIQQTSSTISKPVAPEIAQVETKHDKIHVQITTSAYAETCKTAQQLSTIYANIGCPLTSAIACAIAKTTGKPTTIETQQISKDGRKTETDYRILEEESTWTQDSR